MHNARGRLSRLGFAWTFGGRSAIAKRKGRRPKLNETGARASRPTTAWSGSCAGFATNGAPTNAPFLVKKMRRERSENPQPTTSPTPNLGPKSDESEPEPWKARPSSPW